MVRMVRPVGKREVDVAAMAREPFADATVEAGVAVVGKV
jgi:hypothetical protein